MPTMTAASGPSESQVSQLETEVLVPTRASEFPNAYTVGAYEIEGVIGKGGMGIVYRARVVGDCGIPQGTVVALKMLSDSRLDDSDRRRFEREAAYLQALRHPGIVRILDIGEHEKRPFLVMQMVEGQTLDQILRKRFIDKGERCLNTDQAADILTQALEALHTAHLAGIIHRDIKPGNIMLTPNGAVKLLDFGMAQRNDVDSRLTATGSVLGTPAYMSPEQASGIRDRVDVRSDIYSVGAVCYELVTGHQPFQAENSMAMLRQIVEGEPTPPTVLRPHIDPIFEVVVLKAMAKDQRDRYRSAEEMAEDLRLWRAGERIRGRRPHPMVLLGRKFYQHRRTLSMLALGLFIIAVGTSLLVRQLMLSWDAADKQRQEIEDRRKQEELKAQKAQKRWVVVLDEPGVLNWQTNKLKFEKRNRFLKLADKYKTFQLADGVEHPRLSLVASGLEADATFEVSICDGDVGLGYVMRVQRKTEQDDRLMLLRTDPSDPRKRKLVTSKVIDATGTMEIEFARGEDGTIAISIDGMQELSFFDALPIEGEGNDQVHLVGNPSKLTISHLKLENLQDGEVVSGLVPAIMKMRFGRLTKAIDSFEAFIEKHPDSPDILEARYRLGLCLSADESALEQARAQFDLVMLSSEKAHEGYYLAATVQAWLCTIKLKQFDKAKIYEDVIQRYPLQTLFASVPSDTLDKLPQEYLSRALEAIKDKNEDDQEPELAIDYLDSAARLATYLNKVPIATQATWLRGDLQLALGRPYQAVETYMEALDLQRLSRADRIRTYLRMAQAHRISRNDDEAIAIYEQILGMERTHDLNQWARLWMGDLHWYMNQTEEAKEIWLRSPERKSTPGRIMRNLVHDKRPIKWGNKTGNDRYAIVYFNAILALIKSDEEGYKKGMYNVTLSTKRHEWPAPLAKQILEEFLLAEDPID